MTAVHPPLGQVLPQAAPAESNAERERARLAALRDYGVVDQPRQADLDALARLAAYVCGTPAAVINLLDSDRQWPAAAHGCEPDEVQREASMSARTVLAPGAADAIQVRDASTDPRYADSPFVDGRLSRVRLYATAPLRTSHGRVLGSLCVFAGEPGELTDEQLGLLRDIADQVMGLFELRRVTAAMSRLAARDPLTGLADRRAAEAAIGSAIRRAERGLGTPSVVVVDLDGFKAINEANGREAGDAILKEVAERLTRTARSVDLVARLGGDEFVLLLEHTGGSGAAAAVDRVRRTLNEPERHLGLVAASVGFATYRPGDSPASLIARGDAEMYGEKVRARA